MASYQSVISYSYGIGVEGGHLYKPVYQKGDWHTSLWVAFRWGKEISVLKQFVSRVFH